MVVGLTLATAGLLWFTQLGVHSSYVAGVLPPEIIVSFGMGMTFVPMSSTALIGVDHKDAGVASALVNATQQVGGALGTALLNTVAATATASYLASHVALRRHDIAGRRPRLHDRLQRQRSADAARRDRRRRLRPGLARRAAVRAHRVRRRRGARHRGHDRLKQDRRVGQEADPTIGPRPLGNTGDRAVGLCCGAPRSAARGSTASHEHQDSGR